MLQTEKSCFYWLFLSCVMIPAVWNHVSLCAWNSVLGKCEHKVKDNQEWLIIYSITAKSKSNPQPMDMRRAKVNLKQELSQGSSYSPLSSEGQSCCYVIYRQKTKKQNSCPELQWQCCCSDGAVTCKRGQVSWESHSRRRRSWGRARGGWGVWVAALTWLGQ